MIELEVDTNACKGSSNEINYIEHVQAFISKSQENIRVLIDPTISSDPYDIYQIKRHVVELTK